MVEIGEPAIADLLTAREDVDLTVASMFTVS